jgi:hypothetical protein
LSDKISARAEDAKSPQELHMKFSGLRLLLLAFAFTPAVLLAQDTAQITGTVADPSGAAVSGAQVTLTSVGQGTTRTATANSSGDFLFAAVPVGSYNLVVTAQGFKKYEATGIVLNVGQKARTDVTLAVGTSQETVNVEGSNVAQVETQSSELASTITGKEVSQLALNGRNFTQLVTLTPGVSNQTGQDEGTVGVNGNVSFSMNGGRIEYNNWELDGGDNMDNGSNSTLNVYPSIDAIAEFKVLTSNYGAQYGRNGSGTVEVETKSGTNGFHGDVYEFVRNDMFNAKNYFDTSVPPYKKNDYGYTVGGPIWKDHTFFFWSQEWRKERVPSNFNQAVPSVAERSGDFSDLCPNTTVTDPSLDPMADCPTIPGSGGTLYPGNQVPFNAADPNVQALLGYIPLPTTGVPGAEFYNTNISLPTNWREELIRVDHNLTSNERLTFRFIHDSWDTITSTPLWTNAGSFPTVETAFGGPGVSLVTRLTSTLNPTLLNEFVFSYTTDHIILNNVGNFKRGPNITIGGIFQNGFNDSLPGINLVGGDAYGGGFGQDPGYIPNGPYNSNPTYTYRDNMTKIVGKHNLLFGAYAAFGQKNELGGELGPGSVPGYLTFDSSDTNISSGNPFADLLLGNISSYGQQDRFLKYYNRYKIVEPYFQDDWHVSSRLTLNLGLRVSLFGTYREKQKQAFNFDPAHYVQGQTTLNSDGTVNNLTANGQPASVDNLPNGIVQCGVTPGVPVSCMQGHLFNPAPRIGFAYDLSGNGRTAIRGGYGIFFEHANGNEGNTESLENSPPLANAVTQNDIPGYTSIGSGLANAQFPLTVNQIPTKATWPYIQQWHLDLQHELPSHTVVTASYVGSKGTHLSRQTDANQLAPVPLSLNPYAPGEPLDSSNTDCGTLAVNGVQQTGQVAINLAVACGASADPFRPFLGYSDISHLEYKASSIYHAFQLSGRRSIGGLDLGLAYTYSHSIDDASDRFDGSFVNSFDPRSNRASSNFDERHILNFSYVWDLPFFKSSSSRLAKNVLGGWQYSGVTSFNTGSPFTVTYGDISDNAGVGNGVGISSRPDLVGDPNSGFTQNPIPGLGPQWYNPADFAAPRGLTFGTAPRNLLRNPNRLNFDMGLFKHFVINERMGFEFRAEAFNVFNHTQWGNVGGDSGSAGGSGNTAFPGGDFLYIASAHNPRILQLALKFIF